MHRSQVAWECSTLRHTGSLFLNPNTRYRLKNQALRRVRERSGWDEGTKFFPGRARRPGFYQSTVKERDWRGPLKKVLMARWWYWFEMWNPGKRHELPFAWRKLQGRKLMRIEQVDASQPTVLLPLKLHSRAQAASVLPSPVLKELWQKLFQNVLPVTCYERNLNSDWEDTVGNIQWRESLPVLLSAASYKACSGEFPMAVEVGQPKHHK